MHVHVAFDRSKIVVFVTLLCLTTQTEGLPWDNLHKILHGVHRMAKVHSGGEILPRTSTPLVGCINVTDNRQMPDRWMYNSKDPYVMTEFRFSCRHDLTRYK